MSIEVMTMVFKRYPAGGNERLLALALADHARDDGSRIWPSVAELSRKTLQSERSVQRQLRQMVKIDWLQVVHVATGRRGDTNEYRINPSWIAGNPLPAKAMPSIPVETIASVDSADDSNPDVPGLTGDNLSPVPNAQSWGNVVDNVIHTGDTMGLTGDTTGLTGDIAVSPESSGTVKNRHITPPPPVDTGGCGEKSEEQPKQPQPKPQAQGQPQRPSHQLKKPEWRWLDKRSKIEEMGELLGLGRWDEAAFNLGHGMIFSVYRDRVKRAYLAEREANGLSHAAARSSAIDRVAAG